MENELKAVHALLRRPADTGLMGASFGAVASLYTAWRNPGTFGRLLLQSGSFAFFDIGDHQRGPLFDNIAGFIKVADAMIDQGVV